MFIAEISPKDLRGALTTINQVHIVQKQVAILDSLVIVCKAISHLQTL